MLPDRLVLLSPAQHLIHLTRLNLYGCKRFTDSAKPPQGDEPPVRDGLNFIEGLPCLVSLSLGLTRVKLLERLARLTRLTELHLAREWVQREQFMQLSTLTRLEVLSLRDIFGVTANHITVRVDLVGTSVGAGRRCCCCVCHRGGRRDGVNRAFCVRVLGCYSGLSKQMHLQHIVRFSSAMFHGLPLDGLHTCLSACVFALRCAAAAQGAALPEGPEPVQQQPGQERRPHHQHCELDCA